MLRTVGEVNNSGILNLGVRIVSMLFEEDLIIWVNACFRPYSRPRHSWRFCVELPSVDEIMECLLVLFRHLTLHRDSTLCDDQIDSAAEFPLRVEK